MWRWEVEGGAGRVWEVLWETGGGAGGGGIGVVVGRWLSRSGFYLGQYVCEYIYPSGPDRTVTGNVLCTRSFSFTHGMTSACIS